LLKLNAIASAIGKLNLVCRALTLKITRLQRDHFWDIEPLRASSDR
jgi:hypothetical protein